MSTATADATSNDFKSRTDATIQELTELMIAKDGMLPWRSPLSMGLGHHNVITKNVYTKTNALVAGLVSQKQGYSSKSWMTFAGGKSIDVFVNKGEKGTPIQIWVPKDRSGKSDSQAEQHPAADLAPLKQRAQPIPDAQNEPNTRAGFYRQATIFNSDQMNWGTKEVLKYDRQPVLDRDPVQAVREAIGTRMPAVVIGQEEGYDPMKDVIVMMPSSAYRTPVHEAWSLATNAAFATTHPQRMDRKALLATTPDLARELIRAESAATIMLGNLGFDGYQHGERMNSIHNWGTLLKNRDVLVASEVRAGGRIAKYLLDERTTYGKQSEAA